MLKAMLGFGNGSNTTATPALSSSTPVNDLSTLVKRKVKEVVKETESAEKKQKLE